MDLAEFRYAPYGKALKRHQNKGAKPGYKRRLQFYYKTAKSLKKLLKKRYHQPVENKQSRRGLTKMIKSYIMDTDGNEKIGKHFKVKEFACKDGSQVVFIDDYLVSILDILRNQIGKPVIINSGYRTPTRNKAVGGAKYSYHMRGMAADIRVNEMSAKEIADKLNKIIPDECGIIVYDTWVHIDTRTKKYRKGV